VRATSDRAAIRRRRTVAVVVLLSGLGIVGWALASSLGDDTRDAGRQAASQSGDGERSRSGSASGGSEARPNPQRIVPPEPGEGEVIKEAKTPVRNIALTFDDGYCPACVTRIIDVLDRTGAHATFFPNGRYAGSWDPHAARIKRMVADGRLTLGNHTYSHGISTVIGPVAFGQDLQRNEQWIQRTFGITGRPWFRPPYGDYDSGTVAAAGRRGYTKVVMWSGTVADSSPRSKAYILNAIRYWARPGRIILMHANHPVTGEALPEVLRMLERMKLRPVTMAGLDPS